MDCPFGKLVEPVDLWHCKITGKLCPIQADVDPPDFSKFDEYCEAPAERLGGIKKAIRSGEYQGFHHLSGRYLCPTCKPSKVWKYFYEHELFALDDYVDVATIEVRKRMIRRGVSLAAASSDICRHCLEKALYNLLPEAEAKALLELPRSDSVHKYGWSFSLQDPCECGCEISEVQVDGLSKGQDIPTVAVTHRCGWTYVYEILDSGVVHSYTDIPGQCVLAPQEHQRQFHSYLGKPT